MEVRLETRIKKGWKQEDNQRFGDCLELHFINTETNETMFIYAPKLEDKLFFDELFNKLEQYDNLHKAIYVLCKQIDKDYAFSCGDCKRIKNDE